jgi:serine/threonine protein kinase
VTLVAGTRLGPYEIVAPLGAGGMGEVYRARDPRLGRDVAVKVLPSHLSANAEVRARFEREAKAVAALSHPHICALYDVGTHEGADYLVMELLEGETLAARLGRGPLPLAELLRLGAQIADALDKAHRKGLVHRDLKPANVMLTKSGAKLLDFGLARGTGLASGGADAASSPTLTRALTTEGSIVGTFLYMSPEQLEGKDADARSDLWALGCVLYEMATGARAFAGGSQASLISSIMKDEPRALAELAPLSPPALERVIRACLAKDPDERLQTAHDARLHLQWLAEGGSQTGAAPVAGSARFRNGRRSPLQILSLLVGVLGLAVLAFSAYTQRAKRPPTLSVQVPIPPTLRLTPFWSNNALSPDGGSVVSAVERGEDDQGLWLWNLKSASPTQLSGTERAYFPSWSPDSRSIAFFRAGEDGLFRVPAAGGPVTRVCDAAWGRGVSWGRKGILVYAPNASGPLMSVPAGGGVPVQVTALDAARQEAAHRYPYFLPDGEHFLFAALPAGPAGFEIYVGSLGSRNAKRIMQSDCAPIYAEPGYLVFVQGGKVMVQRFDPRRLEPVGGKLAIADAPAPADFTAEPVATASRDQRLLFPSITVPDARVEWLDRGGASRGVIALPAGAWTVGALSPDARFATATKGPDLWQIDLERAITTRVAPGVHSQLATAWSPDGRRIAMDAESRGRSEILLLNAGGSGAIDTVRALDALFQDVADWSPDGRSLLVAVMDRPGKKAAETNWDLWTVPLAGGGPPVPFLRTPGFERYGRVSPDGRWAVCEVLDRGQEEIFVDSYPVPGHRVQVAAGPNGGWAMWGRGGREVLYVDAPGNLLSLPLEFTNEGIRPGTPTRLFRLPDEATGLDTRDGERFLVSYPDGADTGASLQLILGWTGLLQR